MQRTFITGDKWLYYKLYCGEKTADLLLTDVIKPVCGFLLAKKWIDKWFFIRYVDPKYHIRLRLLLPDNKNFTPVITTIFNEINPYVASGLINKVQTDTYKREIERYGSSSIELSEALFHIESEMIVDFMNLLEGNEGEKIRWLFSMKYIDTLLSNFNYSTVEKFELMKPVADSFGKEFNLNSSLIKQLSNKYRKYKKDILNFMKDDFLTMNYGEILFLLKSKSNRSKTYVELILNYSKNGKLEIPLNNLLFSYMHMFMNRLFRSKQRVHELVIYGFMFRYYRTQLAKEKYNK